MVLGGGYLGPRQEIPKARLVSAEKSVSRSHECFSHVWGQRGDRSLGSKSVLLFVIISKLFPPSYVGVLCLKVHNFV